MSTMTARLDDWLRDDLIRFWREHGEGPSTGLRLAAEEWWAMTHFPAITFRDGVSGRRAVLRGGPDVWEVVAAAREYGQDLDALHEHFSLLDRDALEQALRYYERFPSPVDGMIEGNEMLERRLRAAAGP